MFSRPIIGLAVATVALLQSPVSFAQNQTFCADDPLYGNVACTGGIGCKGSANVPIYEDYGYGFFWHATQATCTIGYGCYVTTYVPDYSNFCQSTELRKKEVQDQLARLSLTEELLIADCNGHYRQYRKVDFSRSNLPDLDHTSKILDR